MRKYLILCLLAVCSLTVCRAQYRPSVSILGDSYSTFQYFLQPDTNEVWYWQGEKDIRRTDVQRVTQTWWHQLISQMGWRLCVNNSYSGATISSTGYIEPGTTEHADYTPRQFVTRAPRLGCPDILFVFGATNDSWAGSPIGEYQYDGWTAEDLKSFRPGMACLLQRISEYYPNVKVYFILNSELKDEINESVNVICAHYGVPVIALHDIEKISGHPSVKGMQQICAQVKDFIAAEAK
jgi:hypothetical protein